MSSMLGQHNGQFSIPSPAYSPRFFFDLSSADDSSEKPPVQSRDHPVWSQRPKSTPWSSRPHLLKEKLQIRRLRDLVVDIVVICLAIPFFVVGAVVIALNGREVRKLPLSLLEQTIKAAATLFPIFFAYVTGRAAVKFATWKLEQGSSLGILEQLMGSRTVASSITTQIHLRSFNLIGLALVVLWSLSPIGSQAVLYILETPSVPIASNTNVSYINTRQQSYAAPDGIFKGTWFSGFTILFGSALLAPASVQQSSMDLWGNVKIPSYSNLIKTNLKTDEDGWIQIPETYTPVYTALFGIPLAGTQLGDTILTVESSYMELDCNQQTHIGSNRSFFFVPGADPEIDKTILKSTLISPAGPFESHSNVSQSAAWALGYQGADIAAYNGTTDDSASVFTYPKSCPDCLAGNFTATAEPGTLLYQEFDGDDNATNVFCTPAQAYVESSISCKKSETDQNCRVTAQRLSRLPHNPSSVTYLSFHAVAMGVSALLPNLSPLADNNPAQRYLYDPTSAEGIITGPASNSATNLSPLSTEEVPLSQFGERLGQILNTFIYASMWNTTAYTIGASFDGITNTPVGGNAASTVPATTDDLVAMIKNQTAAFTVTGTLWKQVEIYQVSYRWIAIFLFATAAMLVSAVGGVYFSRNTVVPDYLGYVSSLAKESPYVRCPNGGANLDGMDRARLMKHLRVRLGNVDEGRGEVGRLAFARMEETGIVRKDSFYV